MIVTFLLHIIEALLCLVVVVVLLAIAAYKFIVMIEQRVPKERKDKQQ